MLRGKKKPVMRVWHRVMRLPHNPPQCLAGKGAALRCEGADEVVGANYATLCGE